MKWKYIIDIFEIHTAKSKSIDDYSIGDIPFVSNGSYNNGVIGYVEPFPNDKLFKKGTISVSAFCDAIVHYSTYLPRGNGGSGLIILEPKQLLTNEQLLTYAAIINSSLKWKYSYGRMVTKKRFEQEMIPIYDTYNLYFPNIESYIKEIKPVSKKQIQMDFVRIPIIKLFTLEHGDFHSIKDLALGDMPTVSRIDSNNGIVGLYEVPNGANIYKPLLLTVSTVTGDAFVQLHNFIATDNVVICTPIFEMRITTLFFIALSLNLEKWRWCYGRQCYKTKFSKTSIFMPLKNNIIHSNISNIPTKDIIDEDKIEEFITQQWGWDYIYSFISSIIK